MAEQPNREQWDRQPGETHKAFQAFVIYRDLRAQRTYVKVAEMCGKSESLMRRWAKRYDWITRVDAFDRDEDQQIREQLFHDRVRMLQRHARMGMMAQNVALTELQRLSQEMQDPNTPRRIKAELAVRLMEMGAKIERSARGEDDEDQIASINVNVIIEPESTQPPEQTGPTLIPRRA